MKQITLYIGLPRLAAGVVQAALATRRGDLAAQGALFPRAPGRRNHARLAFACGTPDRTTALRDARGFSAPEKQQALFDALQRDLLAEVAAAKPDHLILSSPQLADLTTRAELARLADFLAPLGAEAIHIVAHVAAPAEMALSSYADQLAKGRRLGLEAEMALATSDQGYFAAAQAMADGSDLAFPDVHAPAPWLDLPGLVALWDGAFGKGATQLRMADPARLNGPALEAEMQAAFGLTLSGVTGEFTAPALPSAATLTRWQQMNDLAGRALDKGFPVDNGEWQKVLDYIKVDGLPPRAADLAPLSRAFAPTLTNLITTQDGLDDSLLAETEGDYTPADPAMGFRATQHMALHWHKLAGGKTAAKPAPKTAAPAPAPDGPPETPAPATKPAARGRFKPHNNLSTVDELLVAAPYTVREPDPATDSPRRLIVGCMKNEAPYIVEWVAYHRAIGVDHFLIYTNDCDDGTVQILDRLAEMGLVTHIDNSDWTEGSPQQTALNRAMREPLVQNAEWLIHIDVDEFINIRTGNGTLDDLFAAVPHATNIAMTWRLFGHNNVVDYQDAPVIAQFDACAPQYCPKPHTVWGFKTMTRNIGAYRRLGCHRPTWAVADRMEDVTWVNGSGRPMGEALKKKGWRSSVSNVGYDLVQLNHYALRSAESYLIKRQRGRALHVDRSIGTHYWVRMDWNDFRDLTIQRNLPRLAAEMANLFEDTELAHLHQAGVDWHVAKAAELRQIPEYAELLAHVLSQKFTPAERVAYTVRTEMEH